MCILTERSVVEKSMKQSSDSSPASRTETDFSPLSSSANKIKKLNQVELLFIFWKIVERISLIELPSSAIYFTKIMKQQKIFQKNFL